MVELGYVTQTIINEFFKMLGKLDINQLLHNFNHNGQKC